MPPHSLDFAELLHPVEPEVFFRDYWEQRPLVVHRKTPEYYRGLLAMADVDTILQSCRPRSQEILLVQDQDRLPSERYLTQAGALKVGQLYEAYLEGYTLVLNGLDRYWQPLAELCQSLRHLLNHRVAANMYLAPRHSVSLQPHYDTHDVFVLQTAGAKDWRVHARHLASPLVGSEQPLLSEGELPALLEKVRLEAGDLMYLPRGFIHCASTADAASLHVTVGIYPTQWVDLLTESLRALSVEDQRLREALPVGYLDRPELLRVLHDRFQLLAAHFARHASVESGVAGLAEGFLGDTTPLADGHFQQLEECAAIGADTRVAKRPGLKCRVERHGSKANLRFLGREISGPLHFLKSMEFVERTEAPFSARELPGEQTVEAKIALIRRLVRSGLLKSLDDSDRGR